MSYREFRFPQYPEYSVFLSYYSGLSSETLANVKSQLILRNTEFDFCFLSTTHIISLEQIYSSLFKAIQNNAQDRMKANTLNTEILFNLCPVNNINEALKRFGIDNARQDVIVVSVLKEEQGPQLDEKIASLLQTGGSIDLTDESLMKTVDLKKFKKLFKVQELKDDMQRQFTKEAIAASLLRGL